MTTQSGPVKILFITASTKGGGAAHIVDLLKNLNSERYSVRFMGPNNGAYFDEIQSLAASTTEIPIRKNPLLTVKAILKELREYRPDIIHTHGKGGGVYGRILGAFMSIPVVHTFHGLHYHEYSSLAKNAYFLLEKVLARSTARHICVGREEAREIQDLNLADSERVTVVPNGIEFARFETLPPRNEALESFGVDPTKFTIGTLARLTKQKGLEFLLEGFKKAFERDNSLALLIAGDSDGSNDYVKKLMEYKSHPGIHFLGFQKDATKVFAALDVYITTALWEGLPLTLIEATAASRFPLVSEIGPHREVIGKVEPECFFEPKSSDAVAEKILWASSISQAERETAARSIKERVRNEFSMKNMIAKTEQVYEAALSW